MFHAYMCLIMFFKADWKNNSTECILRRVDIFKGKLLGEIVQKSKENNYYSVYSEKHDRGHNYKSRSTEHSECHKSYGHSERASFYKIFAKANSC